MKVLFAVNNENISEAIIKMYQREFKEIITYKNVYYFNAILKELQKDKSYDRVIISEDLEPFANNNYDTIDKFLFEKLDKISDEATNGGDDIPIILICTDRRAKSEPMLVKMFGIGIYNAILGDDRSVEEVCKLLKSPRSKKEAKDYYKIDADDVGYQSENEDTVSEEELQNILAHYKRLGKDESRYIESFNNIAAQYNDNQLRLIVRILPLNVKAVLEANSPKYQSVMTFRDAQYNQYKKDKEEKQNGGLNIGFIKNNKNKMSKPVVIPSAVNTQSVRKINKKVQPVVEDVIEEDDDFEEIITPKIEKVPEKVKRIPKIEEPEIEEVKETIVEQPKRGRGRPKKQVEPTEIKEDKPKRGRGRPKKQVEPVQIEGQSEIEDKSLDLFNLSNDEPEEIRKPVKQTVKPKKTTSLFDLSNDEDDEDDDFDNALPGFAEDEDEDFDNSLPGFEEDEDEDFDNALPGFDEEDDDFDNALPGFAEDEDDDFDNALPGFEEKVNNKPLSSYSKPQYSNTKLNNVQTKYEPPKFNNSNYTPKTTLSYKNQEENENNYQRDTKPTYNNFSNYGSSLDNLLTGDKKIISFVGTSKNGTSFLVNNLGEMFSTMGIKTAILDTTKNKNSYFIYTKNDEMLRKISYTCLQNLRSGRAEGIQVNKNLTVYTSLPGEDEQLEDYENVLSTLVQNYSVVLIDCDFETQIGYYEKSQETYLVQSMDILTIQPLTAFLRDLKSKGVLRPEKLRIVINKEMNVKMLSAKAIVGGLAYYNDPAMSFMTELFNKDNIKYYSIPFDMQAYARYLEGLVDCEISLNKYSKEFIASLKALAGVVYPLINNKYSPLNNYGGNNSTFSANTNNTLNMMKNRY